MQNYLFFFNKSLVFFKKMVNCALGAETYPVFCHLSVGINYNNCALVPHKPYFRT